MEKKRAAVPLVCHGHSRPVVDLFYSPITPDGFFLISASKDSSPMLRNGETGDWIGTFDGHKGAVWSCCLDNSALRAASGSADFTANEILAALKSKSRNNISFISRTPRPIEGLGFELGFGGDKSEMEKKRAAVPLVCHGHSRPVVDLFYSPITPDGFFLISASKDSSPMLRNRETGDWIGTFDGHKGAVWSCCLDNSALRAASGSADFTAKIWDALTGEELHSFEHKHIVRACAFSQDANQFLTGGIEKILRIYDLNRPEAPPRELEKSPGSIRTVSWLHCDLTILSSCTDTGGVRLWDVRSGKVIETLETKSPVTSAEVSQDERYITTADGSTVKFWDANHFGVVKSFNMPHAVESASLEPKDGYKFIAGGEDMWVRVFDFFTGEEIACNKGHHGPVHCVRFSPGGESYASGSEDGTVRIWQLGTANHHENGSSVKVGASEIARKIEGFHLSQEAQAEEKLESTDI